MTCDHEAQIRDLLEEREELRRSRDEAWAAYREAIGVPESEHQRKRMEQIAQAREESLKENGALRERIVELQAQVVGLEAMNTEKAAEIRRLRMGNHPAGRALRSLPPIAPFADALTEALTERDAEHEEYERCVICHLSIRRDEGGLCDRHKYDGQPPRIKRRQLMGDPTRDALLDYSEWLDSEGLILPDDGEDKRSHRDLVSAFLASAAPATPWGMAPR